MQDITASTGLGNITECTELPEGDYCRPAGSMDYEPAVEEGALVHGVARSMEPGRKRGAKAGP